MKKLLSVILAALMLFSCFAMSASAADQEPENVLVTITYKMVDENGVLHEVTEGPHVVQYGTCIEATELQGWLKDMPRKFEEPYSVEQDGYTRNETLIYTFTGFQKENHDGDDLYFFGTTDEIYEDTHFIATYEIEDTGAYYTFFEVVEYFFAQINRILAYFASIFGIE